MASIGGTHLLGTEEGKGRSGKGTLGRKGVVLTGSGNLGTL